MVTRTCHIQHHIQMDIRCMTQGSILSVAFSQKFPTFKQPPAPSSICLLHLHQMDPLSAATTKQNINGHYAPCSHSITITTGYLKSKCTPISHGRLQRNVTTHAENRSLLEMYLQTVSQWQSTSP